MGSAGHSQQHSLQSGEPELMPASPAEAVLSAWIVPSVVTSQRRNPSAGGASVALTGSALLKVGPHSGRNR